MSKIKIENKTMVSKITNKSEQFGQFVETLGALKSGQSFVVGRLPGHYRVAISVANTLLKCRFITRKEGKSYRVGLSGRVIKC